VGNDFGEEAENRELIFQSAESLDKDGVIPANTRATDCGRSEV